MKRITRRDFIKQSSALVGAASIGCLGLLDKDDGSAPRKEKLGVALLGLGYYSRDLLAPALQETSHCELKGIITGTPSKIPVWQQQYDIPDDNVYNYENMEDIADNDDIDIIYIVTPTSTHEEFAVRAANAGKHVYCEKPMAMTVSECQNIIDACERNGVFLSIGYRLQHETNTQIISGFADEKTFGEVMSVTARAGYYSVPNDQSNWRQIAAMGGGALYDMGVYPINAIRYASGKEPVAVKGTMLKVRLELFPDVDETTRFEMQFADGTTALGETSVGANYNQLLATCENGSFQLEPFQAYSGVQGSASNGITLSPMAANQQAVQMDNDAMAIKNSDAPLVPGIEGLRDIAIVNAIIQSSNTGGDWVQL